MVARGILSSAFNLYVNSLQKRPVLTQVASSALLWGIGDALAQRIEGHPFQPKRCALMATYGGAFNGVVGHAWYIKLDKIVRQVAKPNTAKFVGTKVFLDTIIFGPIHVAAFFTVITLAEGGTMDDVRRKLKKDMVPALTAEVAFWPVVQAVNFWKVPVDYQLLVVNAFTVVDSTFMSWAQHNALMDKVQELFAKTTE